MENTKECRDTFSNKIRTASVHASWTNPIQNAKWEFIKVVIKSASDVSYFSTSGNSFGYGGI